MRPATTHRHHYVTRAYQLHFADPNGRVLLIDKLASTATLAGVKSTFWKRDLCSFKVDGEWYDDLEHEWARIERQALPGVRRVIAGSHSEADVVDVKALASVHYVRGVVFEEVGRRIIDQVGRDRITPLATSDKAREGFTADYGRPPEPGELEALTERVWLDGIESRTFLVEQMGDGWNKTMDLLGPLQLQVLSPKDRTQSFVFADSPVVHWKRDGRVGPLEGVAMGGADRLWFPLSPRMGVMFTGDAFPHASIERDLVDELNRRSVSIAMRFLGAHPATNLGRSCSALWKVRRRNPS